MRGTALASVSALCRDAISRRSITRKSSVLEYAETVFQHAAPLMTEGKKPLFLVQQVLLRKCVFHGKQAEEANMNYTILNRDELPRYWNTYEFQGYQHGDGKLGQG